MKYIFSIIITCFLLASYWFTSADYIEEHNSVRSEVIDVSLFWLNRSVVLELAAQEWADYLAENFTESDRWKSPHSTAFETEKHNFEWERQGENIAWWKPNMSISRAIWYWADEQSDYHIDDNSCTWVCGHYTQIVWQDTTEVWCAHSVSTQGYGEWVVCRYSQAWNYIWEFPYIVDSEYNPMNTVFAESSNAANFLADKWFINNNIWSEELYKLSSTITRKEMMKIVMNISWREVSDSCKWDFSDVLNDWGCKYIESALSEWFIAPNEKFRPNDTLTKSEALKLIFKARGVNKFQETDDWQADYMESAYEYRYITEKYKDFNTPWTRWWIFSIAARSYEEF